jgi:prepilin-type processing-associated H-X9-DG protein
MNSYFGWTVPGTYNSPDYRWFGRTADLGPADPSRIFVFSDMNPKSICHSAFVVTPQWFYHFPFAGHDRAGVLTFADGHVESHRWTSPQTYKPLTDMSTHFSGNPDNPDLRWLLEHASVKK